MKKKQWQAIPVALLVAFCMLFTGLQLPTLAEESTTASEQASAQETYIDAVVNDYRLMSNASNGAFDEEGTITRGELIEILYNMVGAPSVSGKSFKDVSKGSSYYNATRWAKKNGLLTAIQYGKAYPEAALTCEEALVYFAQWCELAGVDLTTATDYSKNGYKQYSGLKGVSSSANKKYIKSLLNAGIALDDSTTLVADSQVTRGQIATMLYKYVAAYAEIDFTLERGASYTFTYDMNINELSMDASATIENTDPRVVTYQVSDDVENGDVYGNVQFVCDYDEVIAIVHTNDVHGHIDVEPYVKGLADELKDSGDYSLVLTVSAGDIYGGGEAVAGSYDGELIPQIVDMVYDVIVPGNNDFGSSGVVSQNLLLTSLYKNTKTLCANMVAKTAGIDLNSYAASYTSKSGNALFASIYDGVELTESGTLDFSALNLQDVAGGEAPYDATATYTTSEGTVVGLFGISTDGGACETQVDCTGSVASSQASVDALAEEGATVIVGVGHTGWMGEGSSETSSNDTNSWQLANKVTNLDAFVDGHTHSIINDGEGVLVGDEYTYVNQAESFGDCIGVMYLYIKDGKVIGREGDVYTDMSGITPDDEVQEVVDADLTKVEQELGQALATTPYFLNGERLSANNAGGTVRGNETNLGDFMTDILLQAASEKMGTDYAFVMYPGFWLRSSIEEGDITIADIEAVFANPTVLYYETYTGQDIVDMVNNLAREWSEKIINQLRREGLVFEVNPVVFMGGGSRLLRKQLKGNRLVKACDFIANPRANADGYKKLMEVEIRKGR